MQYSQVSATSKVIFSAWQLTVHWLYLFFKPKQHTLHPFFLTTLVGSAANQTLALWLTWRLKNTSFGISLSFSYTNTVDTNFIFYPRVSPAQADELANVSISKTCIGIYVYSSVTIFQQRKSYTSHISSYLTQFHLIIKSIYECWRLIRHHRRSLNGLVEF